MWPLWETCPIEHQTILYSSTVNFSWELEVCRNLKMSGLAEGLGETRQFDVCQDRSVNTEVTVGIN